MKWLPALLTRIFGRLFRRGKPLADKSLFARLAYMSMASAHRPRRLRKR